MLTRKRWIEVARIGVTGLIALLVWQGLVPIQVLWVAIAIGLYRLVKTGVLNLIHEHKTAPRSSSPLRRWWLCSVARRWRMLS